MARRYGQELPSIALSVPGVKDYVAADFTMAGPCTSLQRRKGPGCPGPFPVSRRGRAVDVVAGGRCMVAGGGRVVDDRRAPRGEREAAADARAVRARCAGLAVGPGAERTPEGAAKAAVAKAGGTPDAPQARVRLVTRDRVGGLRLLRSLACARPRREGEARTGGVEPAAADPLAAGAARAAVTAQAGAAIVALGVGIVRLRLGRRRRPDGRCPRWPGRWKGSG